MKRRFYRATLPTIVWNPKTNKALVEFVNGQVITEDEEVIKVLIGMGYPEVALDAVNPPEIIFPAVPIDTPDAHPAKTEAQDLAQTKMAAGAPTSPPVADAQEGKEPSKPKRVIKRRDK